MTFKPPWSIDRRVVISFSLVRYMEFCLVNPEGTTRSDGDRVGRTKSFNPPISTKKQIYEF